MLVTKALPQEVAFLAFVPSLRRHSYPAGVALHSNQFYKIFVFYLSVLSNQSSSQSRLYFIHFFFADHNLSFEAESYYLLLIIIIRIREIQ